MNTLRDQIVSGLTQAASATSIRKAFIGLGEDPHIFDQYFISATGTPVFIGNIEDLAQSEHLTVSIGSVTQSGSAETSELNLTLSVVGSWTDALHFIHLLELLPYGATVSQVNLVSSNENGLSVAGATSVKNWRADIQLNVESD